MEFLNSNLAREINRLHEWVGHVWHRRYQAILVSEEELAQVSRLRYLFAHGVKEGLVARSLEWPGVHSVRETLAGEPIRGHWFDRTAESAARDRGEDFDRHRYATEECFTLSPLPCWSHLSPEEYRKRVADLVAAIESEAAVELAKMEREPLGVHGVLRQHAQTRPNWTKRSPAPRFHAATKRVRQLMRGAYAAFVRAFRAAAAALKSGDRQAKFPTGSFPPALPFVSLLVAAKATGPP